MTRRITIDSPVSLLVAIPCLNEQSTIGELIKSIPKRFQGVSNFEILVIDDGSADATKEIAISCGAKVISHRSNRGLGASFRTASEYALASKFDLMVVIDGDLQFNPRQIIDLIRPVIEKRTDVTIGSRFSNKSEVLHLSKMKKLGNSSVTKVINRLIHAQYTDVSSGFRCFSREALLRINTNFEYNFSQEILLEIAYHKLDVIEIPVSVVYFKNRESRVVANLWKYGFRVTKIIARTYRDQYPLRFFWFLASLSFIPAVIFGALFFIHFFRTGQFTGFLFAGFLSAYFGSISMAFLLIGILADMLARMRRISERGLYLLKKNM
jgi:glycosyltransferase involved in cell wall biosynthesis